jgi:hypothetical protein
MKSLRILLACFIAAFASVALVRAEDAPAKKDAAASDCCPMQKKDAKQCPKSDGCPAGSCAKPEKKEEVKSS